MVTNKNDTIDSFVEHNSKLLGMAKSTLFNKARIAEAILDNKFKTKTIQLIKQNKISQNQLLKLLKQIYSREAKKRGISKPTTKIVSDQETSTKKSSSNSNMNQLKDLDFKDLEEIVEASKTNPDIKKQFEQAKNNVRPLKEVSDNVKKMAHVNTSVRTEIMNKIEEAETRFRTESVNNEDNQKCKSCPNAHQFIMECYQCEAIAKCQRCGVPIFTVICRDDFINGVPKYRNPNLDKCADAPS